MDDNADTSATPPAAPPSSADGAGAPLAPAAPVARSIGERLRAGRTRAGLGIAAAAEKLHLDPKVIEALEGDRFAEVGASVYVRGHLRRYGDFVGENGAELVNMYQTRDSRPAAPDLTQVPHPERRADPRRLVKPALVLAAGAVLLTAIWWVLGTSRTPGESTAPAAQSVADTRAPELAPPPAEPAATPVTLSNAAAPAAALVSPAATPAATPTVAPPATPPAAQPREAPPPKETQLRLELSGDSWVEVYDYRGERLFFDVASAGSVQSVSGRGPLRVVLENAPAVTVEVDGQRREIPEAAIEGDRARFVVNRSGSLSRAR
jgi:cytoskeleton protein RodZ